VRRVLAHEAAHGQRRDVAWALLARVVCALCWFNPLAWYAAHRQRVEAELACDDAVIAGGAAADDYATDLVQILRACPRGLLSPLTAGMAARPSQIQARLVALLAADVDRAAVKRGAARALTVGVLLAVAALTVVRVTRATEIKSADHDRQASPAAQADKPEGKQMYFGAKLLNMPKDAPVLQSAEFKKAWASADVDKILAIIREVENADVIASPAITVKLGTKAKIHVPREFRYPVALDENSQPLYFTQKDVGLTIEVLNDWKDGKIALDMKLRLTEFEGFISYSTMTTQDKVPMFKEREKSLSRTLADGESIAEWIPEFSKDTRVALLLTARLVDQPPTVSVAEQLEKIVIPRVEFTDAAVGEVLNYLQKQSKLHDPLKVGVNIVFKAEPTGDSPDWNSGGKLTLNLVDVRLGKILDFIQTLVPYKYKVEERAIYVFPNIETSEVMLVRVFAVPENLHAVLADGDPRQNLMARGIEFAKGATATYLPKVKKLVVRNTLEQLDKIAALLGSPLPAAPKADDDRAAIPSAANTNTKQVEISAKFFNVPKDTVTSKLAEFEKGWMGTHDEIVKIMYAAGADLYSEPRITLLAGQRAKLRGIDGNEQSFTARQAGAIVGTMVDVKPKIQGDKIDLELKLESTVIDGFVQHQDEQGKEITTPILVARKVGSGVNLFDGQSVLFWFPQKNDAAEKTGVVLTVRLVNRQD
jgi:hypothetical protein